MTKIKQYRFLYGFVLQVSEENHCLQVRLIALEAAVRMWARTVAVASPICCVYTGISWSTPVMTRAVFRDPVRIVAGGCAYITSGRADNKKGKD